MLLKAAVRCVAMLLLCALAGRVLGGAANATDVVRIHIDQNQKTPLNKGLHGFNTNMISGVYAYGDAEFQRRTQGLKPAMLRFPGGTVASFYHWGEAGFRRSQLASTASDKLNRRNLKNHDLLLKRRGGRIDFDAFMELCRRLGAKPVLVVNVFSGTPRESADWVKHVLAKGYEVAGWELDNELYLPHFRERLPGVEDYIEQAKQHAAAMRALDPDIAIGVPVHPAGFHLYRSSGHAQRWNRALARETFYSAYVVHMYLHTRKLLPKGYGRDLDAVSGELFGLSRRALDQALKYYSDLFGERSMWVTEWNLKEPGKKPIADTLLHALYVADFALRLMDAPKVTLAGYNTLAGRWNGFPSFTPKKLRDGRATDSVLRASYRVFELLGDFYARTHERYGVKLVGAPPLAGSKDSNGKAMSALDAVAAGGEGRLLVALLNRGKEAVEVELAPAHGALPPHGQYRFVSAARLTARGGKGQLEVQTRSLSQPRLKVPGHSFGVMEWR